MSGYGYSASICLQKKKTRHKLGREAANRAFSLFIIENAIIIIEIRAYPKNTMIPEIEFCNSQVYDEKWRLFYAGNKMDYPPYAKLSGKIRRLEKTWNKDGSRILREIEKVSGLYWKDKKIQCFVVGRAVPFSYPLTMSVDDRYPIDYMADILTHELIHQIFIQNDKGDGMYDAWKYFYAHYKKEAENTIIHIPVHAIHWRVMMRLFDEKRLKREIDNVAGFADYKRAWDIVLQEGAGNIISEFRSRIK